MDGSRPLNGARSATALVLFALLSLGAIGCDDGRPKRVPVAGQVTIDGKPLGYGFIRVYPTAGGRLAQGQIDSQGRFVLTTYEKGDGVTLGTHTVEILAGEPIGTTRTKWHAPKKYSERATSGLMVTIDTARDGLPIELTWDGGKPFVEATP